jgi:uncharacterized iron-regulated membrane protein
MAQKASPGEFAASYRLIWRWHFYAGLFCLPFIVILALSGSVYLFKPQIDAFLDRDFDHLSLSGAPKTLDERVEAALAANPDARVVGVELRDDPTDATRVRLMTPGGTELRALVRPDTLEILKSEAQKSRLTSIMHDLHGELLIGEPGAIAVELAGAWAIVMVITGVYLWWPRAGAGFGGVLYPRLGGGRLFLRDLHAITGVWLSLFALFFLISALPWTKFWGEGFKYFRSVGQTREVRQDWTTGPASALAQRMENYRSAPAARGEALSGVVDEHAEHMRIGEGERRSQAGQGGAPLRATGFDKVAALVAPMGLAGPAYISPPSPKKPNWTARSETQNRPLRVTFEFDPKSFNMVKAERFEDKPLIDRIVGIGVAAHEGQLFGGFNQLLGLVTAIGYMVLVVTSALMWWRRRPRGALGAPPALAERRRLGAGVIGLIVVLGVFLPTLGVSLLGVLAAEHLLRRFAPSAAAWLGLTAASRGKGGYSAA